MFGGRGGAKEYRRDWISKMGEEMKGPGRRGGGCRDQLCVLAVVLFVFSCVSQKAVTPEVFRP